MSIEPPFISLEDAARRVVAVFLQQQPGEDYSDELTFAIGVLAGTIDRERTGMESDAS